MTNLSELLDTLLPEGLGILEELVAINSFSTNVEGNNKVQDVLERELQKLGLRVERIPTEGAGDVLIGRTEASRDKDILLLGHADTVFPPTSQFQSMSQSGDRVVGPGVCDMKGGLVTILLGLKALHAIGRLHEMPLRVVINADEETGSVYSRKAFGEQVPHAEAVLVFETGKPGDTVVTSRVGSRSFLLKVFGKSAHSGSHFTEGANAVNRAAYIVNELRQLTDLSRGLTCNIGMLKGGEAVNVIPDYAECRFELRAEKREVLEEATTAAEQIVQRDIIPGTRVELSIVYTSLPFEKTTEVERLYQQYRQAAERAGLQCATNDNPIRGGSDANFFASHGVPTLDALGPYGADHHSNQEFMVVSSLKPKTLSWLYWLLEERTVPGTNRGF